MTDDKSIELSRTLVALFRGAVSRENHLGIWNTIVLQSAHIEDYVSKIGLSLMLDEADGYAYLKQKEQFEDDLEIPRLIPRHQLSYHVSLMLALLRKQLLDFDTHGSDERFILSKQVIIEMMLPYLKDTSNEVKQKEKIDRYLSSVEKLGFIRKLKSSDTSYEILRIIRSFVDAQWLRDLEQRLKEYQMYAIGEQIEEGETDELV